MRTDGGERLITYLAKYLQKGLLDERLAGKRGYSASRNIVRPVFLKGETQVGVYLEEWETGDKDVVYEKEHGTMWLGRVGYKVIKLK